MKKRFIIIPVVAALAIAGGITAFALKGAGTEENMVFVQEVRSLYENPTGSGRFSGIVENQKNTNISFDTTKKLKELFVEEGDSVKKGDPLFSYDVEKLNLEIEQLQVEIEKNLSSIDNNNEQLEQLKKEREKASSADKPGFTAQILQIEADIAQAQYDIKVKENDIESKKSSVENATVNSPIDATVKKIAALSVDESGNTVIQQDEGNAEVTNENTLIVLQAAGDFQIKGTASEEYIFGITKGDEVIVRSRTDENKTWKGTVSSVNTESTVKSDMMMDNENASSKYNFYVEPESIDGMIVGQHVVLDFSTGEVPKEGVWINSGFIVSDDTGTHVWASDSDGGKLKYVEIQTGEYDENTDMWQITSGIDENSFIAWPDDSCVEGAVTGTSLIGE